MRILLDECLPARLRRELPGHTVETVPRAGWAGIKNGTLLRLIADAARFDLFVTMDKNLPREQKTTGLPFAIVILRAKSNRFEHTQPLMSEVLRHLHEFASGRVYTVKAPI
jgi:predicted nuclease of predicted toxin-antitoxin system